MSKYLVSVVAVTESRINLKPRNILYEIDAISEYEAKGKAFTEFLNRFPDDRITTMLVNTLAQENGTVVPRGAV